MRRHSNSHLCARIWSNNCLRNAQPESSLMRIGRSSLWRITTWSWWLSTSDVVPKPICFTCLPVINARAISNEDGASIGYIGCHIAHVLEMRRGKINMASSPSQHKMHALFARTAAWRRLAESGSQPMVLLFYSLHGIGAIVPSNEPSVFTRRGCNNSSTIMRNIMLFCVNFFLESIFSTSANVNFNQQYHQKVVPAIITAIRCTNTVQYTQRSSSMYHPLAWELNTTWSFQRICHVSK